MDKIKAVLREEAEIEDNKTVQVYDVSHYEVIVTGRKGSPEARVRLDIRRKAVHPWYLPHLCVYDDRDTPEASPIEIWVGTTSYGYLDENETLTFMTSMQEAVDTASYIRKIFAAPITSGTWDWKISDALKENKVSK